MNTKISITQQCLLPETFLTESKCHSSPLVLLCSGSWGMRGTCSQPAPHEPFSCQSLEPSPRCQSWGLFSRLDEGPRQEACGRWAGTVGQECGPSKLHHLPPLSAAFQI